MAVLNSVICSVKSSTNVLNSVSVEVSCAWIGFSDFFLNISFTFSYAARNKSFCWIIDTNVGGLGICVFQNSIKLMFLLYSRLGRRGFSKFSTLTLKPKQYNNNNFYNNMMKKRLFSSEPSQWRHIPEDASFVERFAVRTRMLHLLTII